MYIYMSRPSAERPLTSASISLIYTTVSQYELQTHFILFYWLYETYLVHGSRHVDYETVYANLASPSLIVAL